MNLLQNADRALSGYANAKTDESISASILKILAEVECAAISDGADDDDAEAMARKRCNPFSGKRISIGRVHRCL